jgi:hypothetical protein
MCFGLVLVSQSQGRGQPPDEGAAAMQIGGTIVTAEEYRWAMEQERFKVFRRVRERCGLEHGPGFWRADCNGTTPLDMLHALTVERIHRERTEEALFAELGLLPAEPGGTRATELDRQNRLRTGMAARGAAIYGPVMYSRAQYDAHRTAILRQKAKEKLGAGILLADESTLREFHLAHLTEYGKPSAQPRPFEKVRRIVEQQCLDCRYDDYLTSRTRITTVTVNHRVTDAILPD